MQRMATDKRMGGVAVCVAAGGPPTWPLVRSLLLLQGPENAGWSFMAVENLGVEQARNVMVEKFLAGGSGAEWLLFVDRDAVLHPLTVQRLLSWDKPIVAALAFTRTPPPQPTVYAEARPDQVDGPQEFRIQVEETRAWIARYPQLWNNGAALIEPRPDDALRPVAFTGMHCTLIHRSVLELMPAPWFERTHPTGGPRGAGEDYAFCRAAAELGFQAYVDRSVQAGHLLGDVSQGALAFMAYDQITNWDEGRFDVAKVCGAVAD